MDIWTAGRPLRPPIITLTADVSAFREAMEQARMSMAVFGEAWIFALRTERPVAARHGRVLR